MKASIATLILMGGIRKMLFENRRFTGAHSAQLPEKAGFSVRWP
jgi:hypothetical protein